MSFLDILTAVVGVIFVASCIFLILFVLLHSGKGSGLSDLFGGGGALQGGTVMEKNLDRITVITAVIFFFGAVFLGIRLSGNSASSTTTTTTKPGSQVQVSTSAPASPTTAAPTTAAK